MGVDHGRLHVAMAQELLDRADVMTGFEKMGRERVTERVARGSLGEALFDNGVSYGSLHQGFVDVMAALLFRPGIDPPLFLRKDPLPTPLGRGVGVLSLQGSRQVSPPPSPSRARPLPS